MVDKIAKSEEIILDGITSKLLKTLEIEARKYEIQYNGVIGQMKLIISTYVSAKGKSGKYKPEDDYKKLTKVKEVKK